MVNSYLKPKLRGRSENFASVPTGERVWSTDAHRGDGKRFVVHADEKLTAFLKLEAAIRTGGAIVLDQRTAVFQTERRDTARLVEK